MYKALIHLDIPVENNKIWKMKVPLKNKNTKYLDGIFVGE
jgi:hypothetical protein